MSAFDIARVPFARFLRPTLAQLRFEEVKLKDCMRPEFLFRKDRIWFSLSWDWRDQYLDVCLGRLFWFRDIMPRVVVVGDFSYWDAAITWDSIGPISDFDVIFGKIRDVLPSAVTRVESEYAMILDDFRRRRDQSVSIGDYLGEEVQMESLKEYRA